MNAKEKDNKSEILKEIKLAEESAEQIISDAIRKKEQIISDSNRLAMKLLSDKKAEAQEKIQEELKIKLANLAMEKQKILSQANDSANLLQESSKKNINKAVKLIVQKFEESF